MCKIILLFFLLLNSVVFSQNVVIPVSDEKTVIDGKEFILHTVESGHTLFSISRAYDVPIDDIVKYNEDARHSLSLGKVLRIPYHSSDIESDDSDADGFIIHEVKQGETVFSLLRKYDISSEDFYAFNPEVKSAALSIGQKLRFPITEDDMSEELDLVQQKDTADYHYHKMIANETISSLSREYNVGVDEIINANKHLDIDNLSIGQIIAIPKKQIVERHVESPLTEREEQIDFRQDDRTIITEKKKDKRDTLRFIYHTFKEGETVFSLSQKYNVDQQRIINSNPEIDIKNLSIGQEIRVPRKEAFTDFQRQRMIDSLTRVNFNLPKPPVVVIEEKPEEFITPECDSIVNEISMTNLNVAILMPFNANQNLENIENSARMHREPQINRVSERVTNFYYGFLTALDKYKDKEVTINSFVFDVGFGTEKIEELLGNGNFNNIDLFVGPALGSQIHFLSQNIDSDATIVLPFSRDLSYAQMYENVFMTRTPDYFQNRAIINYALSNPDKNFIFVKKDDDEQKELQIGNFLLEQDLEVSTDFNIDTVVNIASFNGTQINDLNRFIDSEKENIIILNFTGEYEIFRVFTQLFPIEDAVITVIGDSEILNYETIDPNYYLKNNFVYHTCLNINYSDKDVIYFVKNYRKTFKSEPDEFSFWGHDVANTFIHSYIYLGNDITNCIQHKSFDALSGHIQFSRLPDFQNGAFVNSTVYFYRINENFGFDLLTPENIIINNNNE